MYFKTTPGFFKSLFPNLIWKVPSEQTIFLTFDDGPHPNSTPAILEKLRQAGAKASFFLLGANAEEYPDLLASIKNEGHTIACHGYVHLDGWKTTLQDYVDNITRCQEIVQTNMFRPPYGRIKRSQIKALIRNYKIFMWSHMPGDFDSWRPIKSIQAQMQSIPSDGSIIVLHDNPKSIDKCLIALDTILERKNIAFKGL